MAVLRDLTVWSVQQSSFFMKEELFVFILHLDMSWCLFLCHWFKLDSRQTVKGVCLF